MNGIPNFGENIEGEGFVKRRSMDNFFSSGPPPNSTRTATQRSTSTRRTYVPPQHVSRKSTGSLGNGIPQAKSTISRYRSTTPIMYSNDACAIKPPPVEKKLECTLEELCFGCVKKIKITREIVSKSGQMNQEEEILTIDVKPGWKKGTKITFEGKGNERLGLLPADIIIKIDEKRHNIFRREGDDLELAVSIPLVKALTGCTISIPLLGGQKTKLTVEDIIHPGYEQLISGHGMPISEEGRRGNLKVVFLIQFPTDLTEEQWTNVVWILEHCY